GGRGGGRGGPAPPGRWGARRPPRPRERTRRSRSSGGSQALPTDVLVGPVFTLVGPVFLVVSEVAGRLERVHRALGQHALAERLDLHLERALLSQHRLDAAEAGAPP